MQTAVSAGKNVFGEGGKKLTVEKRGKSRLVAIIHTIGFTDQNVFLRIKSMLQRFTKL